MSPQSRSSIERRVVAAAEAALARSRSVAPLDVLIGLGWLHGRAVDEWRQGRIGYLEQALTARPDRLGAVLAALHRWAEAQGLRPSETPYVSATRARSPLRFS